MATGKRRKTHRPIKVDVILSGLFSQPRSRNVQCTEGCMFTISRCCLFVLVAVMALIASNGYAETIFPAGDINADSQVDASDIQLVTNATLGLSIGWYSGDVNRDGIVNALDLQLTVNAALGIDIPDVTTSPEADYDVRLYWPTRPGRVWNWSPTHVTDNGLTIEFHEPRHASGYEIWKMKMEPITAAGASCQFAYFAYIDDFLYKVNSRADLDAVIAASGLHSVLLPTDLTPGRSVEFLAEFVKSGTLFTIEAGPLSSFLPAPAYPVEYVIDDFPTGDLPDCIALIAQNGWYEGQPYMILARGVGPVFWDHTIMGIDDSEIEASTLCQELDYAGEGRPKLVIGVDSVAQTGELAGIPVYLLTYMTTPTTIQLELNYDPAKLNFVDARPGATTLDGGRKLTFETLEPGRVRFHIQDDQTQTSEALGDGLLFTASFEVLDAAEPGDVLSVVGDNAGVDDDFEEETIPAIIIHGAVELAIPADEQARVWYVNRSALPTVENGVTWQTAFHNIQDAIDAAHVYLTLNTATQGAEVWVARGRYDEERVSFLRALFAAYRFENTGSLLTREGVDLYGGFAGTETEHGQRDWQANATIIDGSRSLAGQAAEHVVVGAGDVRVDGFTITGGTGHSGGGVYLGSMYQSTPMMELANCTITNNSAIFDGGGVYASGGTSLVVNNCTFANNSSGDGGGLYAGVRNLVLSDSEFDGNSASGAGGGLFDITGSSTIERCVFTNNTASGGGGLREKSSGARIVNCVFRGNRAEYRGGAISMRGSPAKLINCTIVENSALTSGGGFSSCCISTSSEPPPQIVNCIIWHNTPEQIMSWEPVVEVSFSLVQGGYEGEGNIDAEPLFAAPGDLILQPESPCVDAGTAAGAPAADIAGTTRPQGGGVDMGAYELEVPLR